MKFENYIVGISFVLYLLVGISYLIKKEYAWAVVWCSYATANLGLILASK